MRSLNIFLRLAGLLLVPALIGTAYLYFYPFFKQCAFPATPQGQAPFRLLAFGDPQIEGDTSLPENGGEGLFPTANALLDDIVRDGFSAHRDRFKAERRKIYRHDIPQALKTYRKKLDLWGNDRYLAHIYRTIRSHTNPTHVTVLGDLLGSQWIDDDEFRRRTDRIWNTVFGGAQKIPKHITDIPEVERLGADSNWQNRIIAVAGNHDVGYAGDLDQHRLERFEKAYGKVNWEVRFTLNQTTSASKDSETADPELRLIILNSMNLDLPASDLELYDESNAFLNEKLYWDLPSPNAGTILLTHIPLHKEAGICTDAPFLDHYPEHEHEGGIKEQNHLTPETSVRILEGIIGPEQTRKAIVLNGHDHTGCDTHHCRAKVTKVPEDEESPDTPWYVQKYETAAGHAKDPKLAGVREVTVRSMMGQFGGNAGLLSAWWDAEAKEWQFEYSQCMAGVQHIWWAVHVLDLVVVALWALGLFTAVIQEVSRPEARTTDAKKKQ